MIHTRFLASSPLIIILLLIAGTCTVTSTYHPDVIYLDDHCGGTYNLSEAHDLRIKMHHFANIPAGNYSCKINLTATDPDVQKGITLTGHFRNFYSFDDSKDCDKEAVQIFTSEGTKALDPYCGSYAPENSFTLGPHGILEVFSNYTGGEGNLDPPSFDLLLSSAVHKATNASCPDNYFDCKADGLCVHDDLTCNGFNDCGNDRDEEEGCGLLPMVIAIIAVSVFVAGILLLTFAICCYRRQRAKGMYIQL